MLNSVVYQVHKMLQSLVVNYLLPMDIQETLDAVIRLTLPFKGNTESHTCLLKICCPSARQRLFIVLSWPSPPATDRFRLGRCFEVRRFRRKNSHSRMCNQICFQRNEVDKHPYMLSQCPSLTLLLHPNNHACYEMWNAISDFT